MWRVEGVSARPAAARSVQWAQSQDGSQGSAGESLISRIVSAPLLLSDLRPERQRRSGESVWRYRRFERWRGELSHFETTSWSDTDWAPRSSPLVLQLISHSVCSFLQATSRLLVNYAEPYRSQILDFLFKVMILDPVSQSSGQNRAHCFAFPAVCSRTLEPLCTYWRWRSEEMLRLQVCVSVCLSVGTSLIFNMTPHVVSNYHIPPEDDCLSALM